MHKFLHASIYMYVRGHIKWIYLCRSACTYTWMRVQQLHYALWPIRHVHVHNTLCHKREKSKKHKHLICLRAMTMYTCKLVCNIPIDILFWHSMFLKGKYWLFANVRNMNIYYVVMSYIHWNVPSGHTAYRRDRYLCADIISIKALLRGHILDTLKHIEGSNSV